VDNNQLADTRRLLQTIRLFKNRPPEVHKLLNVLQSKSRLVKVCEPAETIQMGNSKPPEVHKLLNTVQLNNRLPEARMVLEALSLSSRRFPI
jgi:hypothetical protein